MHKCNEQSSLWQVPVFHYSAAVLCYVSRDVQLCSRHNLISSYVYVALSQKYGRRGGLLPSLHSMALYYTRTSQALSCTVTLNCTAPPNTFVYSIPFPCAARSILTTISPLGTRVCLIRRRRHIHGQCYAGHAPLKYANHLLRHTQHTGVAAAAGQSSPAHICV